MKNTRNRYRIIFAGLLIFALAVSCQQDGVSNLTAPDLNSVTQDGGGAIFKDGDSLKVSWPLQASAVFEYDSKKGYYTGGSFNFGYKNKSGFVLKDDALTPPAGTNWGAPVTITVEVDYDSTAQELIFTFGPHGCQFSPRAEVKMDYEVLGINLPVLYYIDDNGNRIKQEPEQIDAGKKWIKISLDHFSRYALVHGVR